MKNVLGKEFLREILRNKGRFLSIFLIVMLGTAFFAGIRSTGGDMKGTADRYYDDTEMMDIRVLSTLGLTEEDLEDLEKIEGIEMVRGGYTVDVLVKSATSELAVKVIADNKDVNTILLEEGREIQSVNECLVDARFMKNRGYSIGDTIVLLSGTEDPLEDSLKESRFTIVGYGNLPYYMDLTRGVGSIGDGSLSGYLVVSPDAFALDVYTEIYVKTSGTKDLNSYSDSYSDAVALVVDRIEEITDSMGQRRYDSIRSDAEEELSDGKKEIADAKKELKDAKDELDEGEEKLADGKKELDDGKKKLDDGKKELSDGKKELDDAEKELKSGKKELEDAEQELLEGQKELASAEQELASGKSELDSAGKELADGKKKLDDGKAQLDAAEAELLDGEAQAAEGRKELDQGAEELANAKAQLDEAEAQLKEAESQLQDGRQQIDDNRALLEAGRTELETQEQTLVQSENQIAVAWRAYNIGVQTLEYMKGVLPPESQLLAQMQAALDATYAQLEGADAQIRDGRAQIEAAKAEIEAGEQQLIEAESQYQEGLAAYEQGLEEYEAGKALYEENAEKLQKGEEEWAAGQEKLIAGRQQFETAKKEYEKGVADYEQGLAEYETGKKAYQDGLSQYEDGRRQYEDGKAQYEQGLQTLADGQAEYEKGLKKWQDGQEEYEEGLKEWQDGEKEYEENLKKWQDGKKEYEEAEAEALPKIADAEQEIADAEEALASMKHPNWYVLGRDKISSAVSYGMDAERMDSLGNVFPVLFFLVAALVSLTAMTRMVEEQRLQIGTMKALGYGGLSIAGKYFGYAMLATVTGGIIGVFIGEKLLPWIIISSYGMLYTGLPYLDTPINYVQGVLAVILSALCTGGATLAACSRKLMESPAKLMRPEAPMGGSRILLERIPFLWKRFSFTRKSTLRNLFRYKKRFIMTIIGIGGCMGLMLVGFGIRDSITVVAQNQYVEIFKQDATVSVDTDADQSDIDHLLQKIEDTDLITDSMQVSLTSITLQAGDTDRTASLYVPSDVDQMKEYVRFRDRVTKESYDYPTEGAALSEKTASMLGVKVGDTVRLQKSEKEPFIEMKVETIVENYVQHYAFISPEFYKELFGEEPEYNYVYLQYEDLSEKEEEDIGREFLKEEACVGFGTTAALEESITNMLETLNAVIWVLIAAAAALAFVVLYNLNSINMTERKRELATLKVLGFYDFEVAMYVYRENILLTIIGIIAGGFIGKVLHLFTILTVEVDLMMFGRVISVGSYLICGALTLLFSVLVNLIMYVHFKKIDMIESLKSVE